MARHVFDVMSCPEEMLKREAWCLNKVSINLRTMESTELREREQVVHGVSKLVEETPDIIQGHQTRSRIRGLCVIHYKCRIGVFTGTVFPYKALYSVNR